MHDAVAVALEGIAQAHAGLGMAPATAASGLTGVDRVRHRDRLPRCGRAIGRWPGKLRGK